MRTIARNTFFNKISELNQHLTTMLFVAEDFNEKNADILYEHKDKLTSQTFTSNKYRDKFNYPVSKLNDAINEYFEYSREAFIVFMYQAIDDYFGDIIDLGQCVYNKTFEFNKNDGFYSSITSLYGVDRSEIIPDMIMNTIEFFRLRRNCIVHRNADANRAFTTLVKHYGTHLNRYWDNKDKRSLLQFNQHDSVSPVTADDVIESFNISRVCIRLIDDNIAQKLDNGKLLIYLANKFKNLNSKKCDANQLEQRFKSFCRLEFDLKYTGSYFDI